jgi:hypothetical protein
MAKKKADPVEAVAAMLAEVPEAQGFAGLRLDGAPAVDSGADSTQGGADVPEQEASFAAPEMPPVESPTAEEVAVESAAIAGVVEAVDAEPEFAARTPEELAASFGALFQPASIPDAAIEAFLGLPVTRGDLRAVRAVIYTLVYGCSSTREREEAAKSAVEVLDKLIGE